MRAPEPTALAEWATREMPQLPFLAPALRRLLEELPAPVDGLSGTERRALQAVAAGARTPPAAFVAAQRLEDAPFLGDTWFYRALSALGQGTARLLETDDGAPLPPPPPLSDSQLFARLELRVDGNRGATCSAAKPTASSCSASTAGSAAPTSRPTPSGAGIRRNGGSCGRAERYDAVRRSARPGVAPVCTPPSSTSSPLTATYWKPSREPARIVVGRDVADGARSRRP